MRLEGIKTTQPSSKLLNQTQNSVHEMDGTTEGNLFHFK
jgi:hypothetical protein